MNLVDINAHSMCDKIHQVRYIQGFETKYILQESDIQNSKVERI